MASDPYQDGQYDEMTSQLPEIDTLQIPDNKLQRCDSGNESDMHHSHLSSGNVSPACSDYGGSCRLETEYQQQPETDALCRKHSEDSALGSSEIRDYELDNAENCDIEVTTPTVKVWPVSIESTLMSDELKLEESIGDTYTVKPTIDHLDITSASSYHDWLSNPDQLDWQDDSETLSDISSQHSHTDTIIRRNSSDECMRSQPLQQLIQRQSSEGSATSSSPPSIITERTRLLGSVGSMSSLDDYFSHLHKNSDDSNTINSGEDSNSIVSQNNGLVDPEQPSDSLSNDFKCMASSDKVDAAGSASPKVIKKRLYRERLSEKSLKLDIHLKEPPNRENVPQSAPIGDEVNNLYQSYQSSDSECSSALHTPATPYINTMKDPLKRWQALKGIMPFIDKHRKQKWVQLAGHQGSFETSAVDTVVLKKFCHLEHSAFTKLLGDPLYNYIPRYHGRTTKDGHQFCELENLLHGFSSPSVMDCKIGIRTYLEDELIKAEKSPAPRKDMYEKMCKINPEEPTEQEHANQAVSKPRYMQWREQISSTSTLGFRIEGIKCSDGSSCINFKTSKDRLTIKTIISGFTNNNKSILEQYLTRLQEFTRVLDKSAFFYSHEIIGSSLLFVHDSVKASVWMIDFGKTTPLPPGISITHKSTWQRGNHEDGYLIGLENLMSILSSLIEEKAISNLDQSKDELH